jgi:hypothetical protein
MFADPNKVRVRRIKRQLKAGASILVALAAGAFLACKGERAPDAPSPYGPDARGGPGPRRQGGSEQEDEAPPDAAAVASKEGGETGTALVVHDAAPDAPRDARAPHVDKNEHRKGMPVRDNLLE